MEAVRLPGKPGDGFKSFSLEDHEFIIPCFNAEAAGRQVSIFIGEPQYKAWDLVPCQFDFQFGQLRNFHVSKDL